MKLTADRFRIFFEPPDPALVAAGAGGVRSVTMNRIWFLLIIAIAPLVGFILRGFEMRIELKFSAVAIFAALIYSMVVYVVMKRRNWRPSRLEGYLTSTFDLTLITGTLLLLALTSGPDLVIHSEAVWAIYLLTIMTSALRLDVRVCFFMGVMAVAQFVSLVTILELTMSDLMENYERVVQLSRVIMMTAATCLAVGVVNRCRSLMNISGFDSLTGLPTRRYFNQRFVDEIARATRNCSALSLVLFDLDRFKQINDQNGHEIGDRVLNQVANLMNSHKRDGDFLARWGGEEFAMILPDTDLQAATRIARRLTETVRGARFQAKADTVKITVSAGLSELKIGCDDVDALFAVADARLFRAKSQGRDQIVSN